MHAASLVLCTSAEACTWPVGDVPNQLRVCVCVCELADHCCVCQSFALPVVLHRLGDDITQLLLVRVGANQRRVCCEAVGMRSCFGATHGS